MKSSIFILLLFTILACNITAEHKTVKKTAVKADSSIAKKTLIKPDSLIQGNTSDNKIFNQCDPNCVWQYYHPFKDTSYVFAVQNCGEEFFDKGKTARIYFGIDRGLTDKIIWAENVFIKIQNNFMEYKDFNGDDIKDILIFSETGARGANSFYFLYLVNEKNKKIVRVKGFENIVNPEYNKKHNVIVAYGFAGSNYYSIYKISKDNEAYKVGEGFEDDFDSDEEILDKKITQILKENK